jgi:fucose permease
MAYAMNMGDFIFGMGTFVTPLIIIYCARRFGLIRTLYGFAAVSVIPLLLGLGVDWEALNVPATDSVAGGLAKLLSDPIVWLCSLAFFFHVPTEASVAMWATTLMADKKVSEAKASSLLSVFWLTFMGSRLLTALALPEGAATTLVVVMAGCSVAITLAIVFCRGATMMCILIIAAGAIVGPIFPTLIAILLGHVEPSLYGRAVGIFFCIGGIGWTAIPIMIGTYAKRTTVQRSFLIASGSAVLLCALSIVLALRLT